MIISVISYFPLLYSELGSMTLNKHGVCFQGSFNLHYNQ